MANGKLGQFSSLMQPAKPKAATQNSLGKKMQKVAGNIVKEKVLDAAFAIRKPALKGIKSPVTNAMKKIGTAVLNADLKNQRKG